MITEIFLIAIIIMSASLVGVFTINKFFEKIIKKKSKYLISFSAGIFLLTSLLLLIESFELLKNYFLVFGLIIFGYFLPVILEKIIPNFHHHHSKHCRGHSNSGKKILIGDSIHNIVDGLILVPAFLVSPLLGLFITIPIFFHELLQELSEFFILKEYGFSTKKALFYNFLTSSTIFIGIIIALYINRTENIQGVLLALSSGFFLNIVFSDLFPHIDKIK